MENNTKKFIIIGLLVAILIAVLAPFLASSNPDGLESTAEKILNPGIEEGGIYESPMPDYIVPALGEEPVSGSIAIVVGVIITFIIAYVIGYLVKNRNKNK